MSSRTKIRIFLFLIGLGLGFGAYQGASHFVKRQQTPPHQKEFTEIKLAFCRYYDQHGAMPADLGFLAEEQRRLIDDPQSGIHWNAATRELRYTYDKTYPDNPPDMLRFLNFSNRGGTLGEWINESTVKQNAPIYKAAGKF